MSYKNLRDAALQMVQDNWPTENEQTLDQWIFSGYGDVAPEPHESTRDLFHVYAMNLLNSGLRGPQMHPFGNMIAEAIQNRLLLGNIVQRFEVADLAEACAQVLRNEDIALRRAGNDNYLDTLDELRRGSAPPYTSPVILRLLDSIVQFSKLLIEHYGGRADLYHQSLRELNINCGADLYESVRAKLEEIAHLPLVGPATGPNFLKDSQIRSLHGKADVWRDFGIIPYCVKPDMHVSRMMLWLTRPAVRREISLQTLTTLVPLEVFRLYRNYQTGDPTRYPPFPRTEEAEWRCIWDIWLWAEAEEQPPVRFDRLLFLIGSGWYVEGQRMKQSQLERYEAVLRVAV